MKKKENKQKNTKENKNKRAADNGRPDKWDYPYQLADVFCTLAYSTCYYKFPVIKTAISEKSMRWSGQGGFEC